MWRALLTTLTVGWELYAMSPCPKPFDVAAWCGDTNCQLDMQPAQSAECLGSRAVDA